MVPCRKPHKINKTVILFICAVLPYVDVCTRINSLKCLYEINTLNPFTVVHPFATTSS